MILLPLLIALIFATLVVPPVLMYVDPDGLSIEYARRALLIPGVVVRSVAARTAADRLSIEYARQALLIPGVVVRSVAARTAAAVSPVLAFGSFVLGTMRWRSHPLSIINVLL
jgi:hypothetical protein